MAEMLASWEFLSWVSQHAVPTLTVQLEVSHPRDTMRQAAEEEKSPHPMPGSGSPSCGKRV